jgi:hypothetical protein
VAETVLCTINFSSMADSVDSYDSNCVRDFVDDAVVTYTNPPIVMSPSQLTTARRTRVLPKLLDREDHAFVHVGRKSRKIFFGGALEEDRVAHFLLRSAR